MKTRGFRVLVFVTAFLPGFLSSTRCNGQAAILVFFFGEKVATEKFHFCIDGGLNVSSLPGLPQHSPLYGLNFGLSTFIKLNEKWSLSPEFKPLSSRGAADVVRLDYDVTLQNPTTNIELNYIDVPILVQYKFSDKISVATGPQISFLTSAIQRTTGTLATGQDVVVSNGISSYMHKETFMVPLQFTYSLSTQRGGKGIDLKARYNIGIMEAFTATSIASSPNSTFQFILSFPFINLPQGGK